MILETLESQIREAFSRLDHVRLAQIFDGEDEAPKSDLERTIRAFEALARGESEEAAGYLNDLTSDGTVSAADIAYVRAFAKEQEGEPTDVIAILEEHLGDDTAIQAGRIRLCLADNLLRAGRYDRLEPVLEPFLQPPGVPQTLEAHLIILEALLRTGASQEELVEQISLVDVLVERGFRLTHSGNVVYYANMLESARIEGFVDNLLNGHRNLLETHDPSDREEITFLLEMGEKHKAPGAIIAAARGYLEDPFPLESLAADTAAYLFASHEQHEAARQAFLKGFPPKRIHSERDLWGPLLLATYHAGHWEEALKILDQHADEIEGEKVEDHAHIIRISSLFQLGRYEQALYHIDKLGLKKFLTTASGGEGAIQLLAHAALGQNDKVSLAAKAGCEAHPAETEWLGDYATAVTFELTMYRRIDALKLWIGELLEFIPPGQRIAMMYRTGDMMLEWSLPECAELCAVKLEKMGAPEGALIIRLALAANAGERAKVDDLVSQIKQKPGPISEKEIALFEGRSALRLGDIDKALALLSPLAADEKFPRFTAAGALVINATARRGDEAIASQEFQNLRQRIGRLNVPDAEKTMMLYEVRQLAMGEHAEGYLDLADDVAEREPGSVEILRLARRAYYAFDADEETREEALQMERDWIEENVKRP